ncbi:MAG: hypothetical protein J2P36_20360 [Ktedonobacteraceae bacterium]|nr:hypothetical protein [Ktedonobacteraceae bacterium]
MLIRTFFLLRGFHLVAHPVGQTITRRWLAPIVTLFRQLPFKFLNTQHAPSAGFLASQWVDLSVLPLLCVLYLLFRFSDFFFCHLPFVYPLHSAPW